MPPRLHRYDQTPTPRSVVARVVENVHPGVPTLVALWITAFETRKRLLVAGHLQETGNNALLSLILVIPIMLAGWGILRILDKRYRLGLFR